MLALVLSLHLTGHEHALNLGDPTTNAAQPCGPRCLLLIAVASQCSSPAPIENFQKLM